MKYFPIILIAVTFFSASVHPEELGFETTADGIVRSLSKSKPVHSKPRTRGLLGGGALTKTRRITVVKKDAGDISESQIDAPVKTTDPSVNLRILFDVGSAAIRSDSFPLLNELGKALSENVFQGKTIIIRGHSDSDGDKTYNLRLSLERAEAVKRFLIEDFGLINEFQTVGYGDAMPLVPNDSSSNKQINRRVELSIAP